MSSSSQKGKGSAYAKRNNPSSAVPLELDSDSDFNPGSFVPEPIRGRKRVDTRRSGVPPRKRRRKEALEGQDRSPSPAPDDRKQGEGIPRQRNMLVQLFGSLGILPVEESEKEDADDEEEEEEEEEEEDEDEERGSDEDYHHPPTPKAPPPPVKKPVAPPKPTSDPDDSVTEYESDEVFEGTPATNPSNKRSASSQPSASQPPPSKKAKLDDPEDSVTEPEPDDFDLVDGKIPTAAAALKGPNKPPTSQKPPPKKATSSAEDSGSETEPEEDPEMDEYTQPRPAFKLKPGQSIAGPLVLDRRHKVPARITMFLREYQKDGVRFFYERYIGGRGGLLGDDMGLGKTIQVISFLSAVMQKRGDNTDVDRRRKHVAELQNRKEWRKHRKLPPANATWPTCLIIAPSTVVGNWEREFETWGYFEVGMYIGAPAARADVLNDFKMGRLDVVVTSFDIARGDIDLIDELPWSCIFIDEVHRVKNPRSKLAAAFSRFTCPCRFGLSGTVIQNGYEELWTVLNWTNPGAVGTRKQWEKYVEKPLRIGQSKSASDDQHVTAALVAKTLTEKLLPALFLRRTKEIIQNQLPKKTDQVVFCPLTPMQIAVYKRILGLEAVDNLVNKDRPCDCGSGKLRKKCCHPVHPGDLFKYMSTLIKISNHLSLILPSPTDTTEQTARNRELSKLAFNGVVPKYGPSMLRPEFCGKWQVLETLLRSWREEGSNKVLIFTKSVKLLDMLEFHLHGQGHGFVKLDGSTKQSDRMPMIDKFQEDPDIFIFLISTMAGGTGLNLTAANKVVIFDPNWNPAHDLQAMDRAYRFGQTRDVSVYRLLGAGSIEELIYARQVYKQQQMQVGYNASLQTRYFEGVQGDKSKQGELFGIKNIFRLHEDTYATKMAIEQANVSDLDWAFAYMGGSGSGAKPRPKTKPEAVKWVYEEEAKTGKEFDELRGLGALLFDDDTPVIKEEQNDVEKTLSALGVRYTHRNDDLIAENAIEQRRVNKLLEAKKKEAKKAKERRKSGKDKPPEPEYEWPPRRGRQKEKRPPSPENRSLSPLSQLRIRQDAMIDLGLLDNPVKLPKFAEKFKKMSAAEQDAFLAQLDDYAAKHFKEDEKSLVD